VDEINNVYHYRLHLCHSTNIDNMNAAGIVFAINKQLTLWKEAEVFEIIPGRAITLKTKLQSGRILHILNVYAPNAPSQNANFWTQLTQIWTSQNLPKLDIMLGDFNIVECSTDHLPMHPDNRPATEALMAFRTHFLLLDRWRNTYGTTCAFSFHQISTGFQSRIDGIHRP
jgi:exonuclease III